MPLTQSPVQWAVHLILPWFTLALVQAAVYTRLIRGSLLDVLGEDYIRTARAKGLRRRTVIYKHGVRAALTPVVTQLGIDVGTLLAGAFVTEQRLRTDRTRSAGAERHREQRPARWWRRWSSSPPRSSW